MFFWLMMLASAGFGAPAAFAGANQQLWVIANFDYRPVEDRRLRLQLQPRSNDLIGEQETTDRDFERLETQGSYLQRWNSEGSIQLWAGAGFTQVTPLMEGVRGERRPYLEAMPRYRTPTGKGMLTLDLRSRFEVRFQDQTRVQTRFRLRPLAVFEPGAQAWPALGTLFFEGAIELFTTPSGTRFQWVDQSRFMASSGMRFAGVPLVAALGPMVRFQRGQATWIGQIQLTYAFGASGASPVRPEPDASPLHSAE